MRKPSFTLGMVTSLLSTLPIVLAEPYSTQKHEAGRCAIRDSCGKTGFFGSELPCPDNGKAEKPSAELRDQIVKLCGPKWSDTDVCCTQNQVDTLATNLGRAQQIIESCPACKDNFFNLFCTFTCSPDQSLFVNVTSIDTATSGKDVVTELDQIWSTEYQSGFYDSCKEVKFGAANSKAMSLIGGGAKDYPHFLKFLGDKKFAGSPFQINFLENVREGNDANGMKPVAPTPKACNDSNPEFRCNCVDCPAVCPTLPAVPEVEHCSVGTLPCFTFSIIVIYAIALLTVVLAITGHVWYQQRRRQRTERLQLLHDAMPSDDEDDDDDGYGYHLSMVEKPTKAYPINQIFDRAFSKLGRFCARYPALTIGTNLLFIAILSCGWSKFEVEREPVKLWVSPNSEAAQEKAYFDENFGPFYRTQQVFLVNDTDVPGASVLSEDILDWWFREEEMISQMGTKSGIHLKDICFNPTGDACVVQSVKGWFGASDVSDWKYTIEQCAEQPGSSECLPPFMDPLQPGRVLGGFENISSILESKAMIITWVVNNGLTGSDAETRAMEWEEVLKVHLLGLKDVAKQKGLRLSFNTEMSLEQELNKSTNTDAKIVVVSYIVMFFYVSLALGSLNMSIKAMLNRPANILVQSKFTLAIIGIAIVLMSVSGSVGLFSFAGVKVTLIIAEVIPFLVLAVGVDNIFLIVHEFERVNVSHPDEEIDDRMAKAMGRMGPSIFLSASTETIAFAMGAFVDMPAVKNFAAYAAGAVFINAILQITMFVSVLALNQQRVESLRADCFPCIVIKSAMGNVPPGSRFFGSDDEGFIQKFIRKTYAPWLLNPKVKVFVFGAFMTMFACGLGYLPRVELGLDQRVALPSDSYMIPYFNDLYDYFGSGPPVYFVARDVNMTERKHQQQTCGLFTACEQYSLASILEQESKRPNVSYLSTAANSWVDDYLYWLKPSSECCMEHGETCLTEEEWTLTMQHLPTGNDFIKYAEKWIQAPTTEECPHAGAASYGQSVVIDANHTDVPASHWRSFHTPLQSQNDLINSYAAARRIAKDISTRHDIDIFPYSKHYVFFDQYRSIIHLTATLLTIAVVVIFLLTALLLGSLTTAAVVALTATMILIDIIGVMALTGVSLNALSLVNLIISVGIAVEFCAHIARAYTFPNTSVMERCASTLRSAMATSSLTASTLLGGGAVTTTTTTTRRPRAKDLRAHTALASVGGSVFSGITITKFLGVCVLAFTRSKIFEVYYFRIWLALVLLASTHALIFLPVALAVMGGQGYTDPESDGGLEEDLASRRYRSLMQGQDYDSDEDD